MAEYVPVLPHAEPEKPHRVARTDWWFVKQWPPVAKPGDHVIVRLRDRNEKAVIVGPISLKWWLAEAADRSAGAN